jgi:hypothetical protein
VICYINSSKIFFLQNLLIVERKIRYLFVGYFLKSKLEGAIARFPDSMKKKLKFLLTQSSESSFSSTSSASLQTSANVQIPVSKISSHGLHDCSSSYFEPNSSSSEVPMSAQTSTLVNNAPGGTTTASFQTLSEQNVGGNSVSKLH